MSAILCLLLGDSQGMSKRAQEKPCNDGVVKRMRVAFPSPNPKVAFSLFVMRIEDCVCGKCRMAAQILSVIVYGLFASGDGRVFVVFAVITLHLVHEQRDLISLYISRASLQKSLVTGHKTRI